MIVDLILSNTKAYVKKEIVDCSVAINNGKIFKIGKEANMPKAQAKIDLKNLLVLPGLIDAHVHLRGQGKAYKEDFYSGTAAAAAGGITTVLDMPNNDPVTMSAETVRNRMENAENKILVNVGFYSEFPRNVEEIAKIVEEGAVAFKLFMTEQVGGLNIDDDHALVEAFKIISGLKISVAVHAEDKTTLKKAEDEFKRANRNGIEAFLKVHSENVEVKAIKRLLSIAEQTNVHTHFCHVSTENGLKAIIDGKKSEKHHTEALWNGIKKGWIDILASDHAPHALEEKKAKVVWDVKVGIPNLETTLPLLLTEVKRGRLSIADVARLMAEKPAEIFKLKSRGYLKEGNNADLTVVDLNRKYKIEASKFHSKAKYSPFDQWTVEGKPVKTFVNGQLIMDEGEIVAKLGSGKIIRREKL